MNNLELTDEKAKAGSRCTMCYRCINYCPRQAITLLGKKVVWQSRIEKYLEEAGNEHT
jgi:ferredoxin